MGDPIRLPFAINNNRNGKPSKGRKSGEIQREAEKKEEEKTGRFEQALATATEPVGLVWAGCTGESTYHCTAQASRGECPLVIQQQPSSMPAYLLVELVGTRQSKRQKGGGVYQVKRMWGMGRLVGCVEWVRGDSWRSTFDHQRRSRKREKKARCRGALNLAPSISAPPPSSSAAENRCSQSRKRLTWGTVLVTRAATMPQVWLLQTRRQATRYTR